MDDEGLLREKLDPRLLEKVRNQESQPIPVIIQTEDGLKAEDRTVVSALGGRVKDDLYIINAFSADLSVAGIESLVLSPRVRRIYLDGPVQSV
jgi:hypothetical protein